MKLCLRTGDVYIYRLLDIPRCGGFCAYPTDPTYVPSLGGGDILGRCDTFAVKDGIPPPQFDNFLSS